MKSMICILLFLLALFISPLRSDAVPVRDTGSVKKTIETSVLKAPKKLKELTKLSFTDALLSVNTFRFCEPDSTKGISFGRNQGMLGVDLAGVPLRVQYNLQATWYNRWEQRQSTNYLSLSFDAAAFQQKLAGRLQSLAKPEEWLGDRFAIIDRLKAGAMQRLYEEVTNNAGLDKSLLSSAFPGGWDMISTLDQMGIQQRLLDANGLQSQAFYVGRLSSLQDSLNQQQPIDKKKFNELLASSNLSAALEKAAAVIAIVRQGWQQNGLAGIIESFEVDKANAFRKLLMNSPQLRKGLAGQLNLTQMERLFMNINRFTSGATGFHQGQFGLDQSFLTNSLGLDLMMNNNGGFSFTGGVLPGAQSSYEQTLGGMQVATSASGIRYSNPSSGAGGYAFGLMAYNANNSNILGLPGVASIQKQLVFSVEKNMLLGASGNLALGISRLMNTAKQSTDLPTNTIAGQNETETNNFFSNLALKADYSNEYKAGEITHEAGILFSGLAYTNPGNSFMSSGANEFYHALTARFFKGKLTVSTRNNFRYYLLDAQGGNLFTQSHIITTRLRLPKGNSISMRYQPTMSRRNKQGVSVDAFRSERLSVDANVKIKSGKWTIQHFSSLAYAAMLLPIVGVSQLEKTGNVELNSSETFSKGNAQYYLNHSWSYGLEHNAVLPISNSSAMVEAGTHYGGLKGALQFSSGVGYQNISGWYSQLFLRQSVNGNLSRNIQVQASFNIGAMIDRQTTLPVQNCRSEISLIYQISK